MPEGTRWNFHSSPSRTIVWPALLPPWKRTTASARSASRSVILPLPSSPHWAPTITIPGMSAESTASIRDAACVRAEERQEFAHPLEPRDGSLAQLLGELRRTEIRGDERRALVLIARVDDRIELLEHPLRAVLGAEVVDVQQVDRGEAVQEVEHAVAVDRFADHPEQARAGIDRDGAPGVDRRLGDDHRQRRLAGPAAAGEP